jgi:hypothetical protein
MNVIIASVLRSSLVKSMGLPLIPAPDTLKGVDDLIRSGLEAYRGSCFNWLLGFTGLVAVGLLFEAPEIWHETVKAIRELAHSCKPERHLSAWAKLGGTVGWVLIIAGVTGELVVDSFVSKADGFVQKFDEILLAETTTKAGQAKTSAIGAANAAQRARSEADKAQFSASNALSLAHAGRKEIARLKTDAGELDHKLQAAETQLQSLETKAGKLDESFTNWVICSAPRVIPMWAIGNISSSWAPLKRFAGYKAIIEFVPNDAEARRAAFSIGGVLEQAGWTLPKPPTPVQDPDERVNDGVEVQPFAGLADGSMWGAAIHSTDVAYALVDFLQSYNWIAKKGFLMDKDQALLYDTKLVPPDGLRIRVGLYPAVIFVNPPGAKDWAENEQARKIITKQKEQQSEQEDEKKVQKYLSTLTPQQAVEFNARREQWKRQSDADLKLAMKRLLGGPCQPLSSFRP